MSVWSNSDSVAVSPWIQDSPHWTRPALRVREYGARMTQRDRGIHPSRAKALLDLVPVLSPAVRARKLLGLVSLVLSWHLLLVRQMWENTGKFLWTSSGGSTWSLNPMKPLLLCVYSLNIRSLYRGQTFCWILRHPASGASTPCGDEWITPQGFWMEKTLRFSTYGSVHPRIERGHGGLEKLYRKEWIWESVHNILQPKWWANMIRLIFDRIFILFHSRPGVFSRPILKGAGIIKENGYMYCVSCNVSSRGFYGGKGNLKE